MNYNTAKVSLLYMFLITSTIVQGMKRQPEISLSLLRMVDVAAEKEWVIKSDKMVNEIVTASVVQRRSIMPEIVVAKPVITKQAPKKEKLGQKNNDFIAGKLGGFKCEECTFSTNNWRSMQTHKNVYAVLKNNPEALWYECEKCHYKTF